MIRLRDADSNTFRTIRALLWERSGVHVMHSLGKVTVGPLIEPGPKKITPPDRGDPTGFVS